MVRLVNSIRSWHRHQRGQILVLAAAGMVAFLGFVALGVDVGMYARDLRRAQNEADTAALAGAQAFLDKPVSETTARQWAEDWAAKNGAGGQIIWSDDGDCGTTPSGASIPWGVSDGDGDGELDTICLAIERSAPSVFARVLGITSFPVGRHAAARAVHADRGAVCPWALKSTDPSDTDPSDGTYLGVEMGKIYAVKVGAGDSGMGNFGILRLYGPGANDYKEHVAAGCANNGYNVLLVGDTVVTETQTGNVGNPTWTNLEAYLGYELTDGFHDDEDFDWCNVPMDWDAVTETGVPTGYDPRTQGARQGCGTDAANGRSGRYMLIPIVDQFPPHGTSAPIDILGIADVYVAGWGEWDPAQGVYDRQVPAGHGSLYIQFIENAPFKPKDLTGVGTDPLAPLRIMLIR